ncbi:MAG TPA: peptide ABC transporter substrate-binding protein, partial [Byssovorax sp.]
GWAPTCMTREPGKKPPKRWLLVARHDALPTYDPATPSAEVPPAPAPIGFVDEDDVGDDASVVGVRATDDLTLDVELENPTPYFTDLTSSTALFPVRADVVEAFLARGQEDLWTRPESMISNGPFMLDTWRFRYEITMKPNPFYWNAKAIELDRIVWAEVEDYHATLNLYKAGDIDQIGDNVSLPSELQPRLRPYKDYKNDPILSVYWFELNTRRPPLDDARVRHALDLAIDKRQVVEKVTRGGQIPATHYVPDMTGLGYADEVADERAHGGDPFAAPERQFDPARARALLGEAGFPVVEENGELRATGMPPLELLYNTSEGHKQIAVAVQGMWKKNLGVSVTLRNEEWRVMLKNFRDGNFQIMRFGWVAAYNHPSSFLETFASGTPQNTTGWGSAAFDDALHAAGREPDRAKSMKLYREAERIAVDAMPRIPLYFYTKSTLVKPWVRGHWGTPRNLHLYEYFWIDPDWAKGAPNAPAFAPFEPPPPGRLGAPLDAGTPEPP